MSDSVDDMKAVTAQLTNERARLRAAAPLRLDAVGLSFSEHNGGAHLIVLGVMASADFWPGTQKWAIRGGAKGFGIDKLIEKLKGE